VAARLPDYMVPAFFALVKSLPLTPSGKLDRRTLSHLDRNAAGAATAATAEATGAVETADAGTGADTAAVAPPRDDVERTLQKIWQDVLGVTAIGIHDDFFALGGHSLIAAELCSRMGRAFDLPLPVSLLFRSKTIAELAAIVRDRRKLAPQSIVTLNDPPLADLPALFLVHSLGGGVFDYRNLATGLAPDQRVYGVQAVLDTEVPASATSIAETASRYLREVRHVQPHGPYILGGWSSGGTIALEMAQQLAALGEAVPCLVILDSAPYNTAAAHVHGAARSTMSKVRTLAQLTLNVPFWILDDQIKGGGAPILWSRIMRRGRSLIDRALAYMHGASTREAEVGGFLDLSRVSDHQREFMQRQYRALREYTPKPYAGRVILYRARTHPLFHLHESERAWRTITSTLDVKVIAGTHVTIVKPPLASAIATDLKARLRGLGPTLLRALTSTLPALAPFAS
jgi:thioesterase domain-containing protein/acyl carrier protein